MVEVLNEPISDRFYSLVSSSKATIKLCASYVKESIVKNIYDNKRSSVKVDFISNFSMPNFYKRSSRIEAFKTAIKYIIVKHLMQKFIFLMINIQLLLHQI